jgi:D-alanyl-D-alanine carboxypeptidase
MIGLSMLLGSVLLSNAAIARVDANVAAAMQRYNIPGASIAVMDGDRTVLTRSYGFSNLERRVPATDATHYEIGSITKQFTAAAIVQLYEAGKVDLDAKVSTYVVSAPHASEITVRELLTQTSGLPDYLDGPDIDVADKKPATFDDLMGRIAGKPLDFVPGTHWAYSNTNYVILGKIIEAVSHERYEDYVRRHFLLPLGMSQTFTVGDEINIPEMAMGYDPSTGTLRPAIGTIGQSFGWSAGDLVSTAGDVAKWDAALRSGKVVSPKGYALMTQAQITSTGDATGYGFGLFVDSLDGQPRIGHTGGDPSFTAANEYFPKQTFTVIALTNLGEVDGHPEAGETLANIVFESLYPDIAAAALQPQSGEDLQVTARVRTFVEQLQSNQLDYSTIAPHLAEKLKQRYAALFAADIAGYGAPSAFVFQGENQASGLRRYEYAIHFGPGVSLPFSVSFNAANQIAGLSFG